jgi:hypothetical protein
LIPGTTRFYEEKWVWNWVLSATSGLEGENTAIGIHCTDHVVLFIPQKLSLTSVTSGGSWVGIVRSLTKAMEWVEICNS